MNLEPKMLKQFWNICQWILLKAFMVLHWNTSNQFCGWGIFFFSPLSYFGGKLVKLIPLSGTLKRFPSMSDISAHSLYWQARNYLIRIKTSHCSDVICAASGFNVRRRSQTLKSSEKSLTRGLVYLVRYVDSCMFLSKQNAPSGGKLLHLLKAGRYGQKCHNLQHIIMLNLQF